MTRDEAISIMNVIVHMLEPQYDTDRIEDAVEMAIKALEQEPCENCCNGNQIEKAKLCQKSYLAGMEHKQEPCEDAVSRQAVIDTIDKWVKSMHVLIALPANEVTPLFESVHELPPVTPMPKMGRWERDQFTNQPTCSKCGYKVFGGQTNYCPACGSKN